MRREDVCACVDDKKSRPDSLTTTARPDNNGLIKIIIVGGG